ncbi:MAG TPA: AAA family ATPase [Verrucomicrobiae bacterium]|jgi:hypothetical protein
MNELPQAAISPLDVAATLAAAANLTNPGLAAQIQKQPRLVEVKWWLQHHSGQPGGLEKLAGGLIQKFQNHFGPACLHDETKALTVEQREQAWGMLCREPRCDLIPASSWQTPCDDDDRPLDFLEERYADPRDAAEKKRFSAALAKISRDQFRQVFLEGAADFLPHRLRCLCVGEPKNDRDAPSFEAGEPGAALLNPWWCEDLCALLLEAMDLCAARVELQLARTEIVTRVFDCLDYAWQQRGFVQIQGDARTGKTEAVEAWCKMNPGKARLVSTPSGKSMADLCKAVAEAIGLPFGPRTGGSELKEQVQYVFRHSGLFLVFDEGHFLLPSSFDRNTQPVRLDWVRTQIVDRKLPIAIVTTPQAFKRGVEKFCRHTGYNFDQFLGRVAWNCPLPDSLSKEDLLQVVAVQGPDIPQQSRNLIAGRAGQTAGYLNTVEAICKFARFISQKAGHASITEADVEAAADEIAPVISAPAVAAAPKSPGPPIAVKLKRGRPAKPAPAPAGETPVRQIIPARALESGGRQISPASGLTAPPRVLTPLDETAIA